MATSLFNFNPSPSFSFSDPGVNPMMQPVSILGQQSIDAPQPAPRQEEEGGSFGENLLSGLSFLGAALAGGNNQIVPSSRSLPSFSRPPAPTGQSVPSFTKPIKPAVRLPQLALPGPTAATAGAAGLSRLGPIGAALGGGYLFGTGLDRIFGLSDKLAGGISNLMGMDLDQPAAFTNVETLGELAAINQQNNAMSAPVFRGKDPIRATYQLGPDYGNEFIMERESGEIFVPSASQLEAFTDGMEAMSQPTATGIGLGGSEGVAFGGGQPPMTQDETRAMLQERFGAPTISAILDLPSGQGLGMMTDAQGRMISPGDDRTAFDDASLDRLARLEQRDLRPGETLQERDTRIADSRTRGTDRGEDTRGEMTFEEARKFVPKGQKETTKAYNERIRAFQTQQNSRLNKLKENLQELKVTGQQLNNDRVRALIVKYARNEPTRYAQVLADAQAMFADGRIKDETEMALYIIEEMGDDVSSVTDKSGDSASPMIDQIKQAGQGGSPSSGVQPGQVVEQGGKRYRFDGVNYNEI